MVPPPATPDDAALLAAEHPAAFGRFYERHVGAVTSYASRRVGGRPELTFDVVAETLARALERRAHYDPARGPAEPSLPTAGAITHAPVPHLRHVSHAIVTAPLTARADVHGRALRTCSEAAFALGAHRLRAALLVDAAGPAHAPPPLPAQVTARRVGHGWLVVDGATLRERLLLLAALRVRLP